MTLEEFEEYRFLDERIITGPVLIDDARRYIEFDKQFKALTLVEQRNLKRALWEKGI